jgi:hypothetical protein
MNVDNFVFTYGTTNQLGPTFPIFRKRNLICRQSLALLGPGICLSQGLYLHGQTQTPNKSRHTSMPRVGFELTISVSGWYKTVHALDCAAVLISACCCTFRNLIARFINAR